MGGMKWLCTHLVGTSGLHTFLFRIRMHNANTDVEFAWGFGFLVAEKLTVSSPSAPAVSDMGLRPPTARISTSTTCFVFGLFHLIPVLSQPRVCPPGTVNVLLTLNLIHCIRSDRMRSTAVETTTEQKKKEPPCTKLGDPHSHVVLQS